ncbi:hypothetical protein JW979_10495 [bacterium]|nr:hypothetical protein [candidate division CSSED10-310 bacterium]
MKETLNEISVVQNNKNSLLFDRNGRTNNRKNTSPLKPGKFSLSCIDMQHIQMLSFAPNEDQKGKDIDTQSTTSTNEVVIGAGLRKPQGIAVIPDHRAVSNRHINEIAHKVICIMEEKYRIEAKRKGFLI